MIIVCEPQCKNFSHEKVNSGFIYGLRLAYPDEPIRLYAHASHIEAIKSILAHDGVSIDNIEYVAIEFGNALGFLSMPGYWFLLKRLFGETIKAGCDKLFFLSFSSKILFLIKHLKARAVFSALKFSLVLHGEFESIAEARSISPAAAAPLPAAQANLAHRVRHVRLVDIPGKVLRRVQFFMRNHVERVSARISARYFSLKRILLWRGSPDYHFIALAPYIAENARRHIDTSTLEIHTVLLPTVFSAPVPTPDNTYPKFAVFGYGNTAMLSQVLQQLRDRNVSEPYEIRIIGMDSRGIAGFANVTAPIRDRALTRAEMEAHAQDIDAFLILYPDDRYTLSCSGSILEALSNTKPVLHFRNECIEFFNQPEEPIGVCSDTVEQYVEVIASAIENYPVFQRQLLVYRQNIVKLRKKFSIEESTAAIRHGFSWSEKKY